VLWFLEELGVDYELRTYKRNAKTMRADPALRQVFPLGRAPIVEVDGEAFAESGAILDGLLDTLGDHGLRPAHGTSAFTSYRFFLHYAEGSLMPPLLVSLILGKMVTGVPFFIRPLVKGVVGAVNSAFTHGEFEQHFGFVEAHLKEHAFFAGDTFSAADIQMSYPVLAGQERAGLSASSHPAIHRWVESVTGRPAFAKALELGGPIFP
jgi:glutathione S-transferase